VTRRVAQFEHRLLQSAIGESNLRRSCPAALEQFTIARGRPRFVGTVGTPGLGAIPRRQTCCIDEAAAAIGETDLHQSVLRDVAQ